MNGNSKGHQWFKKNSFVHREVMPTSPPTVEYHLTELGSELKPAIESIANVGHRIAELQGKK